MRKSLLLLTCFVTATAGAQINGVAYKRFLMPVLPTAAPVPGAFGSQWVTTVDVAHTATAPVNIYPFGACQVFDCFLRTPRIAPGLSVQLQIQSSNHRALFLFVEREFADRVNFTARVRDVSRAALNYGTTIPTPSEDDFRTGSISIGGVPTDSRFRSWLRIYSLDDKAARVNVRLYRAGNASSTSLFLRDVAPDVFLRADSYLLEPHAPSEIISPAMVEIPLDLSGIANPIVRVEIETVESSTRLWGIRKRYKQRGAAHHNPGAVDASVMNEQNRNDSVHRSSFIVHRSRVG
jgi:hypothetical protein